MRLEEVTDILNKSIHLRMENMNLIDCIRYHTALLRFASSLRPLVKKYISEENNQ